MNIVQRIAKNTAVLYAAHIISGLLSLSLFIGIARVLGDVTLGKYSFALAFTSIFAIFIVLGFDTLVTRDVSRDRSLAPKYIGNLTVIKAILSVVTYGLIALIINLMDCPRDTTTAVLIFGICIIFTTFASTFTATFRAFERMEFETLTVVSSLLASVSLGFAALFLGYGLVGIACSLLIGSILGLVISFSICSRKFAKVKFEIDLDFWKKAAKAAVPLGFLSVAAMIFVRIDTVMLSAMKGDAVVGWYNAAYDLVLALKPVCAMFLYALFPVMANLFLTSISSLRFVYEKALHYLFILGLPLAVGAMLLSKHVILLLYGEQFSHSIVALQILAWDILLFFLYGVFGNLLMAMNRQNQMAVAAGTCALMNVILNLVLIPRFSYVGAGIATLATETVLVGLYFYFVSKYLYRPPLHKIVVKPMIACTLMALFVYFCQSLNLAVLIILAVVIYFVMLYLMKGFSKEDMDILKQVIKIPVAGRKLPRSK